MSDTDYDESASNTDSSERYRYSGYSEDDDTCRKCSKTYPDGPLNPFIRTIVPALTDMASATVAISLWKHVNITNALIQADVYCATDSRSCWRSLRKEVKDLSNKLPIPPSITTLIHQAIGSVQKEITKWATYHFRSVFLYMTKDFVVYHHVGDLIWCSDGTINCIETARNISESKSPKLSEEVKYRFLCTYCLEDEMQQMRPILSDIFLEYVDFQQHPLIRYWNCHFSEKLDLIPTKEDLSLDCTMFRHSYVNNWPAKEYFFDRLSPEEQVTNAVWLIDELGIVFQKILLMKLNESQRISVYLERSVQIIMNYVKTGVNWTDVLATWSEVRNLITLEQFAGFFPQLLDARPPEGILGEVWISVDSDFKNHLLNFNHYEYIKKIFYSFAWNYDFNFVMIVLQDLNEDMKAHATKEFFNDFCDILFCERENLRWLDRLSAIYDGKNSQQFKQNFVLNSRAIENLCLEYYSSGDIEGLDDMLNYLFPQMPDRISDYKKTLLQSENCTWHCVELFDSEVDILNKIIVDTLPILDEQNEFRKSLVFSNLAIEKLNDLLVNNSLNQAKIIIDTFLTSDEDRKKLKELLIRDPPTLLGKVFLKSDVSYSQSLLAWVFENENHVKEFKSSISVDCIFNEMLNEMVPCDSQYWVGKEPLKSTSFEPLNRFLNWYFESPNEAKIYKLRRIFSYKDIEVIVSYMKKYRKEEVERLKTTIEWFFEDDADRIKQFNNMYKKCRISTILRLWAHS